MNFQEFLILFIIPLILTIIIEFLVYAVIIRKEYLRLFFYSILINSITNPLLNLLKPLLENLIAQFLPYPIPEIILAFGILTLFFEIIVIISEIYLIKYLFDIDYKLSKKISIIANITSYLFGIAIIFAITLFRIW